MKPHVTCHMATSLDGRTLLPRWQPGTAVADGVFDYVYEQFEFDAWLVGRVTGAEYADRDPYPESGQSFDRGNWIAAPGRDRYGIVLDPHGKIAWGCSEVEGDPLVVALTKRASDAHLAGLRADGVSYIFAGEDVLDLTLLLKTLASELGTTRVLLQGGGGTNGSFLRAGLVDAVSLLLFPAIDATPGAPTLFGETDETPPITGVVLDSCETLAGGAIWLRYSLTQSETDHQGNHS